MKKANPILPPSRRGFTLIELLVVIAIIAVLAAILFPVFAQAKMAAKKTVAISNTKQMAVGIAIYMTDSEDVYPIAYDSISTPDSKGNVYGGWWTGYNLYPAYVSSNADPYHIFNVPFPAGMYEPHWIHSTQTYRKSFDVGYLPGLPTLPLVLGREDQVNGTKVLPGVERTPTGLSLNGLLSTYSGSAVSSPSVVPMLWPGTGATNNDLLNWTNPSLTCGPYDAECRFNPHGAPSANAISDPNSDDNETGGGLQFIFNASNGYTATPNPHYSYGKGMLIAYTDTSVKWIHIGSPAGVENNNYIGDPWSKYDALGRPAGNYPCASGDVDGNPEDSDNDDLNFLYPCFFRPDRTLTRTPD